ncbi:hypothetical protein GIB67_035536, partial [Kingdonia uniflora]
NELQFFFCAGTVFLTLPIKPYGYSLLVPSPDNGGGKKIKIHGIRYLEENNYCNTGQFSVLGKIPQVKLSLKRGRGVEKTAQENKAAKVSMAEDMTHVDEVEALRIKRAGKQKWSDTDEELTTKPKYAGNTLNLKEGNSINAMLELSDYEVNYVDEDDIHKETQSACNMRTVGIENTAELIEKQLALKMSEITLEEALTLIRAFNHYLNLMAITETHHREGVQFMFDYVSGLTNSLDNYGCILVDDMGLGKTLQSITLMYTLLR